MSDFPCVTWHCPKYKVDGCPASFVTRWGGRFDHHVIASRRFRCYVNFLPGWPMSRLSKELFKGRTMCLRSQGLLRQGDLYSDTYQKISRQFVFRYIRYIIYFKYIRKFHCVFSCWRWQELFALLSITSAPQQLFFFIAHTMTRVNLELFLHWMSDMEKWDGFFSQILGVSAEKSRTRMKITAFEPRENVMPPMPDFFFGPFFLVCFLAARKVFLSWAWGKTPYLFPSKNICGRCDSGSLGQPLSPFPPIFSTPGGRHPNLPGRSSHFLVC